MSSNLKGSKTKKQWKIFQNIKWVVRQLIGKSVNYDRSKQDFNNYKLKTRG